MMHIALLILIPLVISGGSFLIFKTSITWKEFLLQLGGSLLILLIGWQLAKWGSLRDNEHLNGRITRKDEGTQNCCHCHDVCDARDKNGKCTSHHEVCRHTLDYHWELQTTVGEIAVEDCSGSSSPPSAWENAWVGEPASVDHGYDNYLLADPDSLFVHETMAKFDGALPSYPKVYGEYKVNHVIGQNVEVPHALQTALREINADLGASNQVDVTLVLTNISDPTYAQALEARWLYGPKNSLNIILGVGGDTIQWARVVTFSRVEMLKVRLRDQLQGLRIDDPKVPALIRSEVQNGFKRTKMSNFEYLARTAQPKGGLLALLYVLSIAMSIGLTYVMNRYDVFGDEGYAVFKYKRRNPFK